MTTTSPPCRLALAAQWWRRTQERLDRLSRRDEPLAPEFASAQGAGGRFRLQAARWGLAGGAAECRAVHIAGTAAEVFNALIVPARPDRLPVFVADLVVTGGAPRLLFVDLQAVGLEAGRAAAAAARTKELAARFAGGWSEQAAPAWALAFSGGGACYVRPRDSAEGEALTDLYLEYLQAWADLAAHERDGPGAAADVTADLGRFKQTHLEESPVAGFLHKVFGGAWADRFLSQFLYR